MNRSPKLGILVCYFVLERSDVIHLFNYVQCFSFINVPDMLHVTVFLNPNFPYLERFTVPLELQKMTVLTLKTSAFNSLLYKACCRVLHLENQIEINLHNKLFIMNVSASIASYGF